MAGVTLYMNDNINLGTTGKIVPNSCNFNLYTKNVDDNLNLANLS